MTRVVVTATWDDAAHLSAEAKASLINAFPPHEREARTKGIPQIGSGAIYPIPESEIVCDPIELPPHFRYFYAMDVGWRRSAALWFAHDTQNDVIYIYGEYYTGNAEPAIHAAAIRGRGDWIPGVIDPNANGRGQRDGESLLTSYRSLDLNLTTANNAVETGLWQVWSRLSAGKIKVFKTLQNFLMEYRIYRRDETGKVHKTNDHLMDCLRYGVMSGIDLAVFKPREDWNIPNRARHQSDYDPYAKMSSTTGKHRIDYDAFAGMR